MGIFLRKGNREKIILKRINYILDFYKIGKNLILDDGTGSGKIAIGLQNRGFVIGIDRTLNLTKEEKLQGNAQFIKATGEFLPFRSDIFSVIISQVVLEHVFNVKKYLQESNRILKLRGIVYLAIPNRMFPIEPHTKMPLITYLPHKLFQQIVKVKKRSNYTLQYISYRTHKQIRGVGFTRVRDIVPLFLKKGSQFYPSVPDLICRILRKFYGILRFFIPTWIWVLEKE